MRRFAAILLLLAVSVAAFATPPTAAQLIDAAKLKAAKEHKNIFVMFDASW